jgi:hypothetical protein
MADERRAVLERVARGEITPAEAASLLEDLESQAAERDPRDWAADWQEPQPAGAPTGSTPTPAPAPDGAATRIRVIRTIGTADIVADPTVREAVAEGPHVARREGDTLVIEGQDDGFEMGPGFMFDWGSSEQLRHRRRMMRRHHHGFRWGETAPLRVRVNPDLPLDVDAQAGRLRIRGVHGPIRANVQAGGTDISDFRGPLDLSVQAGSVTARGRLDQGASRVHCEAGSVRIHLERGSSVRVAAHATLGKVRFSHADHRQPWVIGAGEASLDIDATMGTVAVSAD